MKTILVTGDSRGVGQAIVAELLEKGFRVIGISRTITHEIEILQKEFGDERYQHLCFDLNDIEQLHSLYVSKLKPLGKKTGGIYGFVNNAAMAYDDIITNLKEEPLQKMFSVNVFAPMLLTKYIIRDMLLHKTAGRIIHISSISAHTGYKGLAMYAASKGALEAFSKNTAREWGPLGICSNVICPGFMETEMSSSLSEEQKNRIFNRNSLKKPVEITAVAKTALFLLSEGGQAITGEIIHVDNGTI